MTTDVSVTDEGSLTICEGENTTLECTEYNSYLSIQSVFYGRVDSSVCPDESVTDDSQQCTLSDGVVRRVGTVCNGKRQCEVKVKAEVWAENNRCPGISKYATVDYKCQRK